MTVIVNGQPREVADHATLADLVRELGLDRAACASELNHALVPRSRRDQTPLAPGDRVELVTLVGGG